MAVIKYLHNGQYHDINITADRNPRPTRTGYFFGDSFVSGRDGDLNPENTNLPLHETINELLGLNLVNKGWPGTGWQYNDNASAKDSDGTPLRALDIIMATDLSSADVVILAFGVNDRISKIGTISEEGTIMHQVAACVSYIYQQKPDCRVVLVAPWNQGILGYDTQASQDAGGTHSRRDLSTAMKAFCDDNFIPFIGIENNPFNKLNLSTTDGHGLIGADNRHPIDRGYILLGQWLAGEIARIIG